MSQEYKNTVLLPATDFPMRAELPRREPQWVQRWAEERRYQQLEAHTRDRPLFVLHDGPPYANGLIHMGHAVNKVLKDIVVRSRLLSGYRAPFLPGWDCHGLPIEIAVERLHGKVGEKLDAALFRAACRAYASEQIELQKRDFIRLGVLGDWERPYLTMDPRFEAEMLRALARLFEKGLVRRGVKPVYWCFDCGSALAEAEIEYREKESPAIDVAFPAARPAEFLERAGVNAELAVAVPIWTTTPWTLPGNQAVALAPELDYELVETELPDGRILGLWLVAPLVSTALARYGARALRVLARLPGRALEGFRLRHPYEEREVPLILGEHVSAEEGTGAVHTAPGHGEEDFQVGRRYGLTVSCPLGGDGRFDPNTPLVGGLSLDAANRAIIARLTELGRLLAHRPWHHSYPHCWRHRTPVAFRATPQWFIAMETERIDLRAEARRAIQGVHWYPEWGQARIEAMVANRPDWCISRQRTWGVPLAIFVERESGEPHPRTPELLRAVADRVEREGIEAWHRLEPAELLGAEASRYRKLGDVLDVWLDSGLTHHCVLAADERLARPADLYLEGSDQHRGWFQSSLLTSVALDGQAPYRAVLTHGFVVDGEGRKMSKSLGNVIAPQAVVERYGADVLRLWVASADYRGEIHLSEEILTRAADVYRRIRNTCRFLLGNLAGFVPRRDLLPLEELLPLDRYAVHLAWQTQQAVMAAYADYDFPEVVKRLQNFCAVDMGAFYLDAIKDRLYTMRAESRGRRSAQSAVYRVLEALSRWMAPILCFTADEVWSHMPDREHPSPVFERWYEGLAEMPPDAPFSAADFERLLAVRSETAKALEALRKAERIGASLDAEIELYLPEGWLRRWLPAAAELRFPFLVSALSLHPLKQRPDEALSGECAGEAYAFLVRPSGQPKCVRCWHRRADVGADARHPKLCSRCVENVEGPGEDRRWF